MDTKELELLISTCKDLNVLYVEDNDEVRFQTSKMLSVYFNCITQAINGKDGLEKFKSNKFDAVFTDINMSVMDGISMIKKIKKLDSQIPIVIFSAYDNTEYFLQTIECGIDGYILKPFRFEEIQKIVEKIALKLRDLEKLNPKIELVDDFYWNKIEKCLYQKDKEISLTKKETILFELLSSSKNKVATSQEIEIEVFDDNYSDNKRVRSLLSRLRCKVGCDLMQSIYSQGYKLNLAKNVKKSRMV